MIEPRAFRDTLGRFATGVTVVTTEVGGRTRGITVNAFLSLSLEPPLIGISIDRRAGAHETLRQGGRFGVSVLHENQARTSDHFAGRPDMPVPALERLAEVPVVEGAIAQLACRIVQTVPVGDHTLFVSEVEAVAAAEGPPLLFYRGRYGMG